MCSTAAGSTSRPSARPRPKGGGSGAEARSAGAAPILRGQTGYREALDGDGDGVACER
ncbi:MAG: hypothetical protein C4315_10030 [Chloroflexota bacterium]